MSNLDILEQKIGQAIEKLQHMSNENQELRDQIQVLEQERTVLQGKLTDMEQNLQSAAGKNSDLDSIKGRVDGILSKFELLDL
jgi:predicted  nucleic acid-binding Zn-ribbon protein